MMTSTKYAHPGCDVCACPRGVCVAERASAHLLGHTSLAEMVSTHIAIWREALSGMLTRPDYDPEYVAHEIKALADIEAACKAELTASSAQ